MELAEYELMHSIENHYWWFVGRRRLAVHILRRTGGIAGGAILDVGCGTGGNMAALQEFGQVSGCDIAPEAVEFCRRRGLPLAVHQPEPDRLPFDSGSFKLVTCFDVLEHVARDSRMLEDMCRVLAPGGALLLTVPAQSWLWTVHDESLHHRRRYRRRDLFRKLNDVGLSVERAAGVNAALMPLIVPTRWIRHRLTRHRGATSDFHLSLPGWLNSMFLAIFSAERLILPLGGLPWGLSLLVLARKR